MYTIRYADRVEKIIEEKEVVKKTSILHSKIGSSVIMYLPFFVLLNGEGEPL